MRTSAASVPSRSSTSGRTLSRAPPNRLEVKPSSALAVEVYANAERELASALEPVGPRPAAKDVCLVVEELREESIVALVAEDSIGA